MNTDIRIKRLVAAIGLLLFACAIGRAQTPTTEFIRTNWTQRTLTNVIEITMPSVFVVNQYRTNTTARYATNVIEVQRTQWSDRFVTNIFVSYKTNTTSRSQTNLVTLDRFITNYVTLTATNWITRFTTNIVKTERFQTNVVNVPVTNWTTRTVTNTVVVEQTRTNLLAAYRTNVASLTVTNWETVLVFKTNLITMPVTNTATIDIPTAQPATAATVAAATTATTTTAAPAVDFKGFAFAWSRPAQDNKLVAITLVSSSDFPATLDSIEWRVERWDSAILVMGNKQEFRTELPDGEYNVTAKFRTDKNSPMQKLRGIIKVTADSNTHQSPALSAGK